MKVKCSKVHLFNKYQSVDELKCDEFFVRKVKNGYRVSMFVKNYKHWRNFKIHDYIVFKVTSKYPEYYMVESLE